MTTTPTISHRLVPLLVAGDDLSARPTLVGGVVGVASVEPTTVDAVAVAPAFGCAVAVGLLTPRFGVAVDCGRGDGVAVGARDETTVRCGPDELVVTGTTVAYAQTR